MRVPLSWLHDYVDYDLAPEALAEKLTMVGLAVEAVEDLGAPVKDVVVGRIIDLKPHPSAARLLVAEADWGHGPRTLVTGAKNLKPGDLVPVAPENTVLPGGKTITAAEFAGVVSRGMLCSAAELGLEKQSDGILVLEEAWPLGMPIAKAIGLDETVLEIELTPNRADCLGLLNVAREVAAITGGRLRPPASAPRADGPAVSSLARVEVLAPALCPRYGGKVFLEVRIAPSPAWMQRRLRAAGIRPINNLVDITNFVMLELNQPLHAFDLDRLREGRLLIRQAEAGETLRTLDETERRLEAGMLVIADPDGPVALAGVMGGAGSEVTPETTRVFLEGACFDRVSIRRTAKALAMRTEASLRFERGVDPAGVPFALDRAAALVEELGAGRVASGTIDIASGSWAPRVIVSKPERINGLLGTDLSVEEISGYLNRLGFATAAAEAGGLAVTVPTHRQDVEGPADLAEEVARLHGYDRIPPTYPASSQVGRRTPAQDFALRARRLLRGLGQTEVVTYSFCSPKHFDRLRLAEEDACRGALRILSPLSEEWAVMRTTLFGGILDTIAGNTRRGVNDVQIFELAHVYLPVEGEELPREPLTLAGGLTGSMQPRGWAEKPRAVDFYDLKGLMEAFLEGMGLSGVSFIAARHPSLHPGRSAALSGPDGKTIGYLGEAHPRVAAAFDLRGQVYLYELNLDALSNLVRNEWLAESPPRFPAIARDLALVVRAETPLAELEQAIVEHGGDLLASVELFDVYTGSQVQAGGKSMAFTLTFRAADRTLTDAEVNVVMAGIMRGLEERFGVSLRQ
ncbi:MAG: phenylalanine--tRNA ligase subunit beta [Bacteroidota bacterium]